MPLLEPGQLADGYPAGQILGEWPMDVGDLRLGRVDEYGGQWIITGFSGRGGPPPAVDVTQRTSGHGAWIGGRWWAAKPYTIDGAYEGMTVEDRWAAEQRLNAAVGIEDVDVVFWDETPRRASCVLSGELVIDAQGPYAFTFQIPLLAPDPFRYAVEPYIASSGLPIAVGGLEWPTSFPAIWDAVITSGSLLIDNQGNDLSFPTFRVYGPLGHFALANPATGDVLGVNLAGAGVSLVEGEWLDVNMRTGQMLLLGQSSRRRALASGGFFGLPPGRSEILFGSASAYNPTAFVRVTGYSTWR